MTAEHFDAAVRHCTGAIEEAQRRGLVMQFCFASLYRARVSLLRGSLADAIADAQLSLDAIDSYGLEVGRPNTVAVLSQALLDRGDADEARKLVQRGRGRDDDGDIAQTGLFEVRARLRLADDDPAGALDELVELGRFLEALGIRNPALSSWRSLAALASLGLDRRDDALRYAHVDLDLARQWGSPRVLGESLVAAGLAEGGGEGPRAPAGGGCGTGTFRGSARACAGVGRVGQRAPALQPPLRCTGAASPRPRARDALRCDTARRARWRRSYWQPGRDPVGSRSAVSSRSRRVSVASPRWRRKEARTARSPRTSS